MTSRAYRLGANPVLLVLVLTGGAAMAASGFVAHAPNRLVSGTPLMLWQATGTPLAAAIAASAFFMLAASFLEPKRVTVLLTLAAAAALFLLLIDGAGAAAAVLQSRSPPIARTTLGPAFWIAGLCDGLAMLDALQRLGASPRLRVGAVAAITALVVALAASGRLDALSLAQEYAARRSVFADELARHCGLVLGALVPALAIGVPLGTLAARRAAWRGAIFAALNLIQTVPSIALFGLLVAPLGALGLGGVGVVPALIALVLYALLPIARNSEAAILSVDPAIVEAAFGMGMTRRQIFWRVEAPLGLPVVLAGVRIVTVQTIGLVTVAALVGAGGLGTFVFQGIGEYAIDLVLLGAVPTILLALAADFGLAMLIAALQRRTP